MMLTNFLLLFSLTILIVRSNPLNEQRYNRVYSLICSNDKLECDLVEAPVSDQESEIDDSKFQKFNKRFYPKQDPIKVNKKKDIDCITQDCKLFMTKDKRTRHGAGTLTCLGDPYSNSGSRCVPIEGLYIG